MKKLRAQKSTKLLGISPGTKTLGFAIVSPRGLQDWGAKEYKGVWSEEKLHKILNSVQQLIRIHHPSSLVLKLPHPSRTSTALDTLVNEIQNAALNQGITVQGYPLEALEQEYLTKRSLIDDLVLKYPVLKWDYQKVIKTWRIPSEKAIKTEYGPYEKVFEALAAIERTLTS